MTPTEFFEAVDRSLEETKGDDPMGCDYFISDMHELFEKWESKSRDLERSIETD